MTCFQEREYQNQMLHAARAQAKDKYERTGVQQVVYRAGITWYVRDLSEPAPDNSEAVGSYPVVNIIDYLTG